MLLKYFTKAEKILWTASVVPIIISSLLFDRGNYLTLIASLIGVTSIIINAKGNPFGQFLMIIFSLIYGGISYSFRYYGEMVTYLGMTMPMAIFALISWLKNPFKGKKTEVTVHHMTKQEYAVMGIFTVIVTVVFFFILKYFNTSMLPVSTLSITTSFGAVYLTYKRCPYFSVFYALNDIVLIILWTVASFTDKSYISVVVCFASFLANDIYCLMSWKRMEKRQGQE